MAAGQDAGEEQQTAVEEASIIQLVRTLLDPQEDPHGGGDEGGGEVAEGARSRKAQEDAGTLLWDMSTSGPLARLIVKHRFLDCAEVLVAWEVGLARAAGGVDVSLNFRAVEIAVGVLSNLVLQPDLAAQVARREELLDLIVQGVLFFNDTRCLSELCRLGSLALRKPDHGGGAWLRLLAAPDAVERLMCLDLVVALLHADAGAAASDLAAGSAAAAAGGGDAYAVPLAAGAASGAVAEQLVGLGLVRLVHAVLQQALQAVLPEMHWEKQGIADDNGGGGTGMSGGDGGGGSSSSAQQQGGRGGGAGTSSPDHASNSSLSGETLAANGTTPEGPLQPQQGPASSGGGGRGAGAAVGAAMAGSGGGSPERAGAEPGPAPAPEEVPPPPQPQVLASVLGPLPVSAEATDAALRVLEELLSREGAQGGCGGGGFGAGRPPAGEVEAMDEGRGDSAAGFARQQPLLQELLPLLPGAEGEGGAGGPGGRLLQPSLPELLLGLLLHSDSSQVLESVVVVLVDLAALPLPPAPAVAPPQAGVGAGAAPVTPSTLWARMAAPGSAGPCALRLAELLSGATSDEARLLQGGWYLLAGTLRAAAAAAAATAGGDDGSTGAAPGELHSQLQGRQQLLSALARLEDAPCPPDCAPYARACAGAGLQLLASAGTAGAEGEGGGHGCAQAPATPEQGEAWASGEGVDLGALRAWLGGLLA